MSVNSLIFILSAFFAFAKGFVVELDSNNFDLLTDAGTWMIAITSPSCPHCVAMLPEWEEASLAVDGVRFGNINGAVYRSIGERFQIKGFPSLFHIRNIQTSSEDDQRFIQKEVRMVTVPRHTAESFVRFAREGWKTVKPRKIEKSVGAKSKQFFLNVKIFLYELMESTLVPMSKSFGIPLILLQFISVLSVIISASIGLALFASYLGPRKSSLAEYPSHWHID